jgi:hypothetical protein
MKIQIITKCNECVEYKGRGFLTKNHVCKLIGEIENDPMVGISELCPLDDYDIDITRGK